MRRAILIVCVVACQPVDRDPGAPATPPAPAAPAIAPSSELDAGTFLLYQSGRLEYRETFSVRAHGATLLASATRTRSDGKESQAGEIEVDRHWRPLRASRRRVNPYPGDDEPGTWELTLAGDPPVLAGNEIAAPHTATGRVDVLLDVPGFISMTTLCQIDREVELALVDVWGGRGQDDRLEAYMLEQTGSTRRIVFDYADADWELLCDGDRLIAGGNVRTKLWFVREGQEPRLEALKAAARPPKRAWRRPGDVLFRWLGATARLVDDQVLVVREVRRRGDRFTSHDARTGELLAQRVLAPRRDPHDCVPLARGQLACLQPYAQQLVLLDARTLATVVDLTPIVVAATRTSGEQYWSLHSAKGDELSLVHESGLVTVDVTKRTARLKRHKGELWYEDTDPRGCFIGERVTIGKQELEVASTKTGSQIVRVYEDGRRPTIATLDVPHVRIVSCAPRPGGLYVTWTSRTMPPTLARLDRAGTLDWQLALPAPIDDLHIVGDLALAATEALDTRAFAIDLSKRTVLWTAPRELARP